MKKYVFKPYNPIFIELYEREKSRINQILGEGDLIEHVGSTAVYGLGGKGIVDIVIATDKEKMRDLSAKLQQLGYKFVEDSWGEEKLFHFQDLEDLKDGIRRYHVHILCKGSPEWKRMIKFRDYLRNNPADREKYAKAKIQAADLADDSKEKYMSAKEPVIREILEKAKNHTPGV